MITFFSELKNTIESQISEVKQQIEGKIFNIFVFFFIIMFEISIIMIVFALMINQFLLWDIFLLLDQDFSYSIFQFMTIL